MTRCAAIGCKNVGVHIFPKEKIRRKLWEKAVRRKNWKASDTTRLCADHFVPNDYFERNSYTGDKPTNKVLKKRAVPSKFSFTGVKPLNPSTEERQNRLLKRSKERLSFEPPFNPKSPGPSVLQFEEDQMSVESEVEVHSAPSNILSRVMPAVKQCAVQACSKSTQINIEHVYGSIEKYKNNDGVIAFYTGFESYAKFYFVFSTLSPMVHKIKYYRSSVQYISAENQFFMTMMKLRQNKCYFELADFFQISPTTVSNIFITWINFIHQLWTKLNIWPEKELLQYYMPDSFKQYDKHTRVIKDGIAIKVQKPGNPISQQASWSSYKHSNTLKVLVESTPGGLLSTPGGLHSAYAGSISDRQTVERSDPSKKCEPGDTILADRGYNIQDMFINKDTTLNIPTFLRGKGQIPCMKLLRDRKLASQRVHIERLIGLSKTYKILKEELHHSFVPMASKNFFCGMMCCNFRECTM